MVETRNSKKGSHEVDVINRSGVGKEVLNLSVVTKDDGKLEELETTLNTRRERRLKSSTLPITTPVSFIHLLPIVPPV